MRNLPVKILIIGFTLVACEDFDSRALQQPNEKPPDQEGWNSVIVLTNLGQPTAVIKYKHMTKYLNKKQTHFDGGILVDFFNKEGEHASHLTAGRGVVYDSRNNFDAYENVILVSDSGSVLMTEELKWDNARKKIFSNVFSTFTTADGDTLYGDSFESDARMQNVKINQPRGVTHTELSLVELDTDADSLDSVLPDTTVATDSLRRQQPAVEE
ncbi:MAG: LPS export ABC transporter periplasmic protein LptC [Calditrichaeota bacterium]|nr:MAG: LPS export ABC transporter periplasmic protein LptC [Calditrichota bacterium]